MGAGSDPPLARYSPILYQRTRSKRTDASKAFFWLSRLLLDGGRDVHRFTSEYCIDLRPHWGICSYDLMQANLPHFFPMRGAPHVS